MFASSNSLQRFDRDAAVGVDANVGRNRHGFPDYRLGVHVSVDKRPCRRKGIIAAGSDPHDSILGLEHVAGARQHERDLSVGHQHHGFKAAEIAICPPVLGKLYGRPHQLTRILLKLAFQAFEKREGIGGRAGESADHVALGEPAHLLGVGLDNSLADRDLTVAANDGSAGLTDRENRGTVPKIEILGLHGALLDRWSLDLCTQTLQSKSGFAPGRVARVECQRNPRTALPCDRAVPDFAGGLDPDYGSLSNLRWRRAGNRRLGGVWPVAGLSNPC